MAPALEISVSRGASVPYTDACDRFRLIEFCPDGSLSEAAEELFVNTLAFGMPGGWEFMVIGLVMLLLFGSRLPSVARSIGDAMREFKKGVRDITDEPHTSMHNDRSFSSAKPPLNSGGHDARVSHGDAGEPDRSEPVRHESSSQD